MGRGSRFLSKDADSTVTLPADAIPAPATFNDGGALPQMVVFDLDYTLWPFWVDTHVSGPLRGTEAGRVVRDRYGQACGFYNDVGGVLGWIRERGIRVGVASRTSAPDLAREMLRLLRVPVTEGEDKGRKAIDMFDHMEIYPGSKKRHFAKLREKSGIEYEQMLFFDDEQRNKEVESMGVTMRLVRDGVTREEFDEGVKEWRKRSAGRTTRDREQEDE